MSTLIEVRNSSGIVGRCDAKCYNAKNPDCDCICGGANHGAGFKKASENTKELAEAWIEEYSLRKKLTDFTANVPIRQPTQEMLQLPLL